MYGWVDENVTTEAHRDPIFPLGAMGQNSQLQCLWSLCKNITIVNNEK